MSRTHRNSHLRWLAEEGDPDRLRVRTDVGERSKRLRSRARRKRLVRKRLDSEVQA